MPSTVYVRIASSAPAALGSRARRGRRETLIRSAAVEIVDAQQHVGFVELEPVDPELAAADPPAHDIVPCWKRTSSFTTYVRTSPVSEHPCGTLGSSAEARPPEIDTFHCTA